MTSWIEGLGMKCVLYVRPICESFVDIRLFIFLGGAEVFLHRQYELVCLTVRLYVEYS